MNIYLSYSMLSFQYKEAFDYYDTTEGEYEDYCNAYDGCAFE